MPARVSVGAVNPAVAEGEARAQKNGRLAAKFFARGYGAKKRAAYVGLFTTRTQVSQLGSSAL
jgi:hypothetical protein